MVKIYPYKIGSKSAKALAQALKIKRIIPNGRYTPGHRTKIINWGNSKPHCRNVPMVNKPEAVALAANKLYTFQKLKIANIPIPDFTTDKDVAGCWMEEGSRVFARHKLTAHTGVGIEVVECEGTLPNAPLYTKYMRKDKEYRVHIFNGIVIDITEKRKRYSEDTEAHPYIRNLANGWVFCRDGVYASDLVKNTSVAAVRALGLDFGGVDIIERQGKVWILEVNSAPGLEGTTLTKYVEAIKNYYGGEIHNRRPSRNSRSYY